MQFSGAMELKIKKFFQNIFYKIYTKSVGDFFIIFSVLSAPLLSSKCCIFFLIFPNYYEFFRNLFKIIIPTFNTVEFCSKFYSCWVKSREDFSEAMMWGRCLIFQQLDTVLKWGEDRAREEEKSAETAEVGSTSSDIIVALELKKF